MKRIGLTLLFLRIWLPIGAVAQGPQEIETRYYTAPRAVAAGSTYQIPPSHLLDLIDLKALPKPMYSWAVDRDVLTNPRNAPFLRECARIAGSLGVNDYYTDLQLLTAAEIARQAGVGLTLNTSPWHRARGGCKDAPDDWADASDEMMWVQEYFRRTKALELPVNCIAYDSECFDTPHPMIAVRLGMMFALAKQAYPSVPLYWYRNGDWPANADAPNEGVRTVGWYRTFSARNTELWLNRWCAEFPGTKRWAVWTTLGPGYDHGWSWELDLPASHYWHLGRILAADERVEAVILYPGFYRQKAVGFHAAFVAYVKGATKQPLE